MKIRIGLALLGVAITGAWFIAAAPGAPNGQKHLFQYDYRDVPSPAAFASATREIGCRRDYPFVLSGGFTFSTLYEGDPQPSRGVAVNTRLAGPKNWLLTDFNYDESVGGSGPRLSVACGPLDPHYAISRGSLAIAGSGAGSVTARCKPGFQAISAGWRIKNYAPTQAEILVSESRRVGHRRWRLQAVNVGPRGGSITLELYCSRAFSKLRERQKVSPTSPGVQSALIARCPHGKVAISGGVSAMGLAGATGYVYGMTPGIGLRHWASAVAGLDGAAGSATGYAYCGRPRMKDLGPRAQSSGG